ncbi:MULTISPECIES: transglycosylase SLT domain-containing protein [unclassified Streptomyces]|uniref:transglycosylase SLT domain-containing protein n=1 Tax=unclassified Streptomyces TaxID=2593676 RepID=UPI00224E97DD|nr:MULTISPECIES: transglycosylase SLT domain-containing protein [unclassified Streptomyces]MCX5436435.1 transglycosylase SLT domain-containing protein [Streptomyces sp. NBC_00063]WSE14212.1 transglycosylase SLT domain-containing protein [Streptomyces sp. NBC_01397]WUB96874.1 transglycosylase SLT domain-containing protein [Streptomyces sp. NBC_00569]
MSKLSFSGHSPLTKTHKYSIAGIATLGAAALAFTLVPGNSNAEAETMSAAPVAFQVAGKPQIKDVHASVTNQQATVDQQVKNAAAKLKATQVAATKKAADAAAAKAKVDTAAKAKAEKDRQVREAASRAAARKPIYANNLDGWIRQSLDIMKSKGIPGSYEGLHRNILRESSGNPQAINNWDINAINGIPSKGLLQVIPPTFAAYHVPGTSWNIYDPVANITAAANYAADKYGSMDNVNSAY